MIKISLIYWFFPHPDREIPGNEPGNELPGNEDGFVELSEEECLQLELPKEWIA